MKFFPETIDGLRARFEELLQNIVINRKSGKPEKTGNRNEAVLLLDELKRQGGISRRMYQRYNDFLAKTLPVEFGIDVESVDEDAEDADTSSNEEEEEKEEEVEQGEEDELATVIKGIIDHVTLHDKQELSELLMELRDEVGNGEFLDALIDLELLAVKFVENEFNDGVQLLPLMEQRILQLEASPASPSKLVRAKILLGDINNNRHRIQETFQRIDDA